MIQKRHSVQIETCIKIGIWLLGIRGFPVIANSDRLKHSNYFRNSSGNDDSVYGEEIKLLEWLEGRPIDNPEFIAKRMNFQN